MAEIVTFVYPLLGNLSSSVNRIRNKKVFEQLNVVFIRKYVLAVCYMCHIKHKLRVSYVCLRMKNYFIM